MQCGSTPVPCEVATNRMIAVAVDAPVSLLEINRATRQIPMHYGVAVPVEVQPLLADRGKRPAIPS
jgi:hypothetical protein